MKKIALFLILSAFAAFAFGQKKESLAVVKVKPTAAVEAAAKSAGTLPTLQRIVESVDSNLTSAFQRTRKFDVLTRGDLDAVLKEQDFSASGNANQKDAPKTGNMKGAKYVVAVEIDDFQDYSERDVFQTVKRDVENRKIRVGVVAKIVDSESGSVLETANISETADCVAERDSLSQHSGGRMTDALAGGFPRAVCEKIALGVLDVLFPAKIVGKTGSLATFNRGAGTDVEVGDEYNVYALGEEMVDPDTGEKLGSEEVLVGKMTVVEVSPKFSKGRLSEDNGVEKGQLARVSKKAPRKAKPAVPATEEI